MSRFPRCRVNDRQPTHYSSFAAKGQGGIGPAELRKFRFRADLSLVRQPEDGPCANEWCESLRSPGRSLDDCHLLHSPEDVQDTRDAPQSLVDERYDAAASNRCQHHWAPRKSATPWPWQCLVGVLVVMAGRCVEGSGAATGMRQQGASNSEARGHQCVSAQVSSCRLPRGLSPSGHGFAVTTNPGPRPPF